VSFQKLILVVLATVVIFATGVVTGGLLVGRSSRVEVAQPFWNRFENSRRAVDHLTDLTPEQQARIDQIIRGNQELIADYFRILEPDVQQVFRQMRESIREELTPDQRRRFEELTQKRLVQPRDRRPPPGFRPNQPDSFPQGPGSPPRRRGEFDRRPDPPVEVRPNAPVPPEQP
jgi:hypothetical protein